ncbi:hypothetical protein [Actinokineospora sp.]|uniref:hypothetical protein n=1 Tax=Actinokineospora sp. TaxID=1872133 RepID=UPI004037F2BD
MSYSVLSPLECPRCAATFDAGVVRGTCRCGSPLFARYDLARAAAHRELAAAEGAFGCPEGAACFAAPRDSGRLRGDERVVVLNNRAGIKYPWPVDVPTPARDGAIPRPAR